MNIKSISYCSFCVRKCRIERSGLYFCPNGHYIVRGELEHAYLEMIQPASTGNGFESVNVYRLNSISGEFCDDVGKPLSDIKHESVNSEVSKNGSETSIR